MAGFKPTKLPRATAPSLTKFGIDSFLGADLTNSPANVEDRRSPDCENMIRDVPGKVRKRMGWRTVAQLEGRVNGFHRWRDGRALIHAGTRLYRLEEVESEEQGEGMRAADSRPYGGLEMAGGVSGDRLSPLRNGEDNGPAFEYIGVEVYSGLADARSASWLLGDLLAIADGKKLLLWDGETVEPAAARARIPTVTIAKAPSGGGQEYEGLNLLTPRFTELFLGTASDRIYHLSFAPLDETPVEAWLLDAEGLWQPLTEGTGFTVDREAGTVTFAAAPGLSPVDGEDNVKITAAHTVPGYADRIDHCDVGALFGVSGASDRLFLSGNPDFPGYDWYCGQNDPTYWDDGGYSVLGQADGAITGYSIVSGRLAAHRDGGADARSVVVRQGNLQDGRPAFPIVNTLQGAGAVGKRAFGYLANEPLFLTRLGVYAVTSQDITGEKIENLRSFYLNGKLLGEPDLEDAFALVWKDLYWLCLNGRAYILDGLQATQSDRSAPYSTRQYAGFYCTGIPARVLWEQEDALWFGAQDGRVARFARDPAALASYSDDGRPIVARWRLPDLDGRNFYRNKTFSRFYVRLASHAATGLTAKARVEGVWEDLFEDYRSARYFSYGHLSYSRFTYSNDDTPRTLGDKIRISKVPGAGFLVENGELDEPFGLDAVAVEFVETGYYRA